jgi:hypothetical protein
MLTDEKSTFLRIFFNCSTSSCMIWKPLKRFILFNVSWGWIMLPQYICISILLINTILKEGSHEKKLKCVCMSPGQKNIYHKSYGSWSMINGRIGVRSIRFLWDRVSLDHAFLILNFRPIRFLGTGSHWIMFSYLRFSTNQISLGPGRGVSSQDISSFLRRLFRTLLKGSLSGKFGIIFNLPLSEDFRNDHNDKNDYFHFSIEF